MDVVLSEYSDKSHNVTLQKSFTDQFNNQVSAAAAPGCTGIAEVRVRNPENLNVFRLSFRNWISCVFNTFIHLPSGAPEDSFLLSALKTLFRLSRELLDLYEYIVIGAIKFISVRPSSGNLSLLVRNYKGFSYCIIFPKILDAI